MALAANAELRAVISADGAVPHARVIHTLDLLKQAGIVHVAFATSAESEEHEQAPRIVDVVFDQPVASHAVG